MSLLLALFLAAGCAGCPKNPTTTPQLACAKDQRCTYHYNTKHKIVSVRLHLAMPVPHTVVVHLTDTAGKTLESTVEPNKRGYYWGEFDVSALGAIKYARMLDGYSSSVGLEPLTGVGPQPTYPCDKCKLIMEDKESAQVRFSGFFLHKNSWYPLSNLGLDVKYKLEDGTEAREFVELSEGTTVPDPGGDGLEKEEVVTLEQAYSDVTMACLGFKLNEGRGPMTCTDFLSDGADIDAHQKLDIE